MSKLIHWELCKKLKFDHTNKWYMHNPKFVRESDTHKLSWDFEIQTDNLISARRPYLIIIYKKERTCRMVDFVVPADHRVELKECEKRDKYLDLARELKKPWNMKATIIPIVSGVLGTKGLVQGLEDLEITGCWRLSKLQYCWNRPKYREESWRIKKTCCHSDSSGKPSANGDVKNSQGVK